MKGIVFSIKHREKIRRNRVLLSRLKGVSVKQLLSLYGIQFLFIVIFILGVVLGSLSYKNVSPEILKKLDVLFLSDLENRLEFTAFELFSSSFASGFLFILISFLMSFAAWGMFTLPLLCAFRGFCVGLSSTYMFSQYHIAGIGFYVLVILPGTVLFLFSFILSLKESFTQSICLLKSYFLKTYDGVLLRKTKTYLFRNSVILVFVVVASLVDMLLFLLFSDMFNF